MSGYHIDRKVVLGLGNLLLGDEGFGIHALRYVGELLGGMYPVEYVDGSKLGVDLLPLVEECSHLLVLDVVEAGKPVGTVVDRACDDIQIFRSDKLSAHQVSFQEVLAMAKYKAHIPTFLHLVGVQPGNLSSGVDLSPQVGAALPEAAWRAKCILQTWFPSEIWQPEPDTHPYHM